MRLRPGIPTVRAVAVAVAAATATALTVTSCSDDAEPAGGPAADPAAVATASPTQSVTDSLVAEGLAKLQAGDLTGATSVFEAVLAIEPDNVFAHYNLGYLAQTAGRDKAAITSYAAAIETDPEFAPALYNLAILTESSDLEAAVALYQRVIDIKPDVGSYLRMGAALEQLGRPDEAAAATAAGNELQASQ